MDDEVENDLKADCELFKVDPLQGVEIEILSDDEGEIEEILSQPVEESFPLPHPGCFEVAEDSGCLAVAEDPGCLAALRMLRIHLNSRILWRTFERWSRP